VTKLIRPGPKNILQIKDQPKESGPPGIRGGGGVECMGGERKGSWKKKEERLVNTQPIAGVKCKPPAVWKWFRLPHKSRTIR